MKHWSIRTKVIVLLTGLLLFSCALLTLGASVLNARQTHQRNIKRLQIAGDSVQREFVKSLDDDVHLFHSSLTSHLARTLAFKGMTLIDNANVEILATLTDIGKRLRSERLAFYYTLDGETTPRLRLYYDRKLDGTVQLRDESRTAGHRLIQKDSQGRITSTDFTANSIPFPRNWPRLKQKFSLRMQTDGLHLVEAFFYISAFSDEAYGMRPGEEIGRFLFEKTLDENLEEMAHDLGVQIAVYDARGKMGQGTMQVPDLDLSDAASNSQEPGSPMFDRGGQKYDAYLRPLIYQGENVGYLAVAISQIYTVRQIWETVQVLSMIAVGVLLVAFFLMSEVIVRLIAHPLKHIIDVTHRQLAGELEARIELATHDEYGELGQTFNRFSQQIYTLVQEQGRTITTLRSTEEALRESEARFRRLAENARDMIYRMSLPDGLYEYVSSASTRLLGYTPEEFYNTPQLVADVIHPDWLEYFEQAWKNLLEGEMPPFYEYQIRHKSGEVRWMNQRNVLVRDENGNIIAIEGIVTDVTERKHAEEEIRTFNAELEQRVKDRTAKLEAANKELQSFAYVVSHDLKAPLRAIARLAHWIVEDYTEHFDDPGKAMAETLIGRVKRLDDFIDGILEYSRIGRIIGTQELIDLHALVKNVLDLLAPPAHIQISIDPNLPAIFGDRIRVQQIFINLIDNAVKFMDNARGIIEIHCKDAESFWQFSISDNGEGIAPQYHEKIFQIFQTLRPRDEQENTGIGLSIVKKIVEFYGGRIWVESQPGEGSTFFFTVPKT